jgi:hypothetical protein
MEVLAIFGSSDISITGKNKKRLPLPAVFNSLNAITGYRKG